MNQETQEPFDHASGTGPSAKEEPLDQFLRNRKLQINVLQKLLEKIPVEQAGDESNESDNPKKNQNQ